MINMDTVKNIHLIGIGGCGMSAIAKVLHEMGYHISGSDLKENSNTIRLKEQGVRISIGHDRSNIRGANVIVVSSAIPEDNVELLEGTGDRVPVIHRSQMLAWITNQFKIKIGVAGTHGKTTTTSMIAKILDRSGKNPTYLIGGEADDVNGNAKLGKSNIVVAEADESDGSFLNLTPTIAVVTNIEADHMEYFGTLEKVVETFERYLASVPPTGTIVIFLDHENNKNLLNKIGSDKRIITYGTSEDAEIRASEIQFDKGASTFTISRSGNVLGAVELAIPGSQNVLNSLAAYAVCSELAVDFHSITSSLRLFAGVKRRFEIIGNLYGVMIVDDYAHHPTEIKVTLEAAKLGWGKKRIICVFQPHRFTRTMLLAGQFGRAFDSADVIIITDVYGAGEEPIAGVNGKMIADEVEKVSGKEVLYVARKEKVVEKLLKFIKDEDMVIFAGAGDIHSSAKELFHRLKAKKEAQSGDK
ncbi:MAG: UDP-N-acetylmuramate--L-alanine ligase [Candidatus Saganbacteria bacterium]|nr:UDP-N-acetylmuramate--L-alanine ligase [Candidatus Saganbacteria bacterium]